MLYTDTVVYSINFAILFGFSTSLSHKNLLIISRLFLISAPEQFPSLKIGGSDSCHEANKRYQSFGRYCSVSLYQSHVQTVTQLKVRKIREISISYYIPKDLICINGSSERSYVGNILNEFCINLPNVIFW